MGDFVLPTPRSGELLFVSGGSGITPIVSMIRHLLATGYGGEIVCLHYARHECIFGDELTALARRHPGFRFVPVAAAAARGGTARHFSIEQLERARAAMGRARDLRVRSCAARGRVSNSSGSAASPSACTWSGSLALRSRRQPPTPLQCRLTFAKSGREIAGHAFVSLLEQAEDAGLRPLHGCRMGICHTCKCKKLSGVVRNELTGMLSTEPDEEIQLCMSTPRSDVILEL